MRNLFYLNKRRAFLQRCLFLQIDEESTFEVEPNGIDSLRSALQSQGSHLKFSINQVKENLYAIKRVK